MGIYLQPLRTWDFAKTSFFSQCAIYCPRMKTINWCFSLCWDRFLQPHQIWARLWHVYCTSMMYTWPVLSVKMTLRKSKKDAYFWWTKTTHLIKNMHVNKNKSTSAFGACRATNSPAGANARCSSSRAEFSSKCPTAALEQSSQRPHPAKPESRHALEEPRGQGLYL